MDLLFCQVTYLDERPHHVEVGPENIEVASASNSVLPGTVLLAGEGALCLAHEIELLLALAAGYWLPLCVS
jgi:hypothetical protein